MPPETETETETVSSPNPTSKIRTTKPGIKRLTLTLSVLISFLLGLPFLLKSVEIYRSPLPFTEMDSFSPSITFPCSFHVSLIGFHNNNNTNSALLNETNLETKMKNYMRGGNKEIEVSVTVKEEEEGKYGSVDWGDDEAVDEMLERERDKEGYGVVVVRGEGEVRAVVGKYRHGWIVGDVSEESAVERVVEVFVDVFVNGGGKGKGEGEREVDAAFMPVGADGKVVFSFSLLNAEPADWIFDWDFRRIHEVLLAPVVEALAPIAAISIESQILYHTPKSFLSQWDEQRGSYIFNTKDLPFFLNSNEWHLDTSTAAGGRSKILHLVVYIPSADECPLSLQLPDGKMSMTNSFISPMWGGVIVWNPSGCSNHTLGGDTSRSTIPFEDLQNIVEIFMGQLRQLFGLKSNSYFVGSSGRVNLLASERGFTEWELDVLSRKHTCFNLQSCATTLGSLSRLVQSLPRMIIMDEIGKQVEYSLNAAKLARNNASIGAHDGSAVSSREARSLAEDAFFHPSIMSVSYYSFEHCFAVYSPFFLPVALHVLLAAVKELKRYRRERSKYLTWKMEAVS